MVNLDTAEIAKFDAQAADWWLPDGAFKTLHDINPLRLEFITQHTKLADMTVIDIGCGGGILAESLAKQGALVTAVDMSAAAIAAAKQHQAAAGLAINYQQDTAENLALSYPHAYDIVTCMELLEHVPDPASVIAACARLVKPQGHLFFSTLNRSLKSYLSAILGAEYLLKLLPIGTHDYASFIKPAELAKWLRAQNLAIRALTGFDYQPLTRHCHFTADVGVNYLVYCQPD